jgi:hypothetical protein
MDREETGPEGPQAKRQRIEPPPAALPVRLDKNV